MPKNRSTELAQNVVTLVRVAIYAGFDGGQGRNRTADTRIFSPLLYQLSYLATLLAGNAGCPFDLWGVFPRLALFC